MQIDQDSARVSFPPPLAFLGALLLGLALDDWTGDSGIPLIGNDLRDFAGWLAIVLGAGTMLSAVSLFRRIGTAAPPWKTTSAIVTDGVYRWTRNPMYLGMATIHGGVALVADSLIALILWAPVVLVIQRKVIEREEAYLEGKFGQPYLAYKASVRRWI